MDTPISGRLPTDIKKDDLICVVGTNCISVLKKPFANYMIQMAVSELLNTKLGIVTEMAEKVRKEMETLIETLKKKIPLMFENETYLNKKKIFVGFGPSMDDQRQDSGLPVQKRIFSSLSTRIGACICAQTPIPAISLGLTLATTSLISFLTFVHHW
jgi:hypothetical protein